MLGEKAHIKNEIVVHGFSSMVYLVHMLDPMMPSLLKEQISCA